MSARRDGAYTSFMLDQKPQNRRHFTEAARAAAAVARAAKRMAPRRFGEPELFVVRAPSGDMAFTWEIRRYGGVVIQKGTQGLASMALAKSEGEHALGSLDGPPA